MSACPRTAENAYANNGIYGNTSADHSENDLPGGLVTKTDADIATRPLGPTKTLKAEKKKPNNKKKRKPNRLISFTGAVRRAQETIETNTSPSMNPENKVKKDSPPDPSPSQIKTSAGCEPLMTYRHNMSLKYCEIQDIALNLTAFRILNTTLRNFLAVKSSKPQSKYCGSLTRVACTERNLSFSGPHSIFGRIFNTAFVSR